MRKKSTRPHLRDMESNWDVFWKWFWNGSKPEENTDLLTTGLFNRKTKLKITKGINKIMKDSNSIKIGKTGDSYIRADQKDYRGTYKTIYLLYKSTSKENVSKMEEYYIKKYMKSHPNKVDNKISHRAGNMYSYNGYYYMYLVSN